MVLRLRGEGVSAADLAAASSRLRLPTPPPAIAGWQVVIVGAVDQTRLERALHRPTLACVEWADGVGKVPIAFDVIERANGLYLSLTTPTAFRFHPAAAFRRAIEQRCCLDPQVADRLELAVHEAVANAVLHGNLGMGGMPKDEPEQLAAFCAVLEARLSEPARACRRVHVWAAPTGRTLAVTVADEGAGYAAARPRPVRPERKSGRGLALIRGLALRTVVSDAGRRLTMEFAR